MAIRPTPSVAVWVALILITLSACMIGTYWCFTPLKYQFSRLASDPLGRQIGYQLYFATFYAGLPILVLGQLGGWGAALFGRQALAIGLAGGALLFTAALIGAFLIAFETVM